MKALSYWMKPHRTPYEVSPTILSTLIIREYFGTMLS
jgi:hypothetical protein